MFKWFVGEEREKEVFTILLPSKRQNGDERGDAILPGIEIEMRGLELKLRQVKIKVEGVCGAEIKTNKGRRSRLSS